MEKNEQCESDPAYSIQFNLEEYYEFLHLLDFSNIDIRTLTYYENELREALLQYAPHEMQNLTMFIDIVHAGIYSREIDFNTLEDLAITIMNSVNYISYRYSNGIALYHQIKCDEDEFFIFQWDNILYQLCHPSIYEDDWALLPETSEEQFNLVKETSENIYNYIAGHLQPVSKDVLSTVIDDFSERALSIALSRPGILNYRGLYFWLPHVRLSDLDISQIKLFLIKAIRNNSVVHIDDLYEQFTNEFHSIVSRAFIQTPQQLFSFIETLFKKDFQFARPYISLLGVHIETPREILERYVQRYHDFPVTDLIDYAKKNHVKIDSILGLITSLNKYVLLINRDTIMSIESTGIKFFMINEIIRLISKELQNTRCIAIRDLSCIAQFPKIKIPWNEWLIYSIIQKCTTKLEVGTTSAQFRLAIPIIAFPGEITDKDIIEITSRCSDLSYTSSSKLIESLDDLDDSILGYGDENFDFDWSEDI